MAKKVEKSGTQSARIPAEAEFRRLMKKMKGFESELSETKGRMGSAVERAVADVNLHTDAMRVIRKYEKKNPAQAAEFMLHLTTYWEYMKLGEPEADMLETPEQRGGKSRKGKGRGKAATEAADSPAVEPMGRGTHAVRGGQVVPLPGAEGQGEAEAA